MGTVYHKFTAIATVFRRRENFFAFFEKKMELFCDFNVYMIENKFSISVLRLSRFFNRDLAYSPNLPQFHIQ